MFKGCFYLSQMGFSQLAVFRWQFSVTRARDGKLSTEFGIAGVYILGNSRVFVKTQFFCDFFEFLRDGAEWQRQEQGRLPIIMLAFFCLELHYPVDLIVDEIMLLDGIFPIQLFCFVLRPGCLSLFLFIHYSHNHFFCHLQGNRGERQRLRRIMDRKILKDSRFHNKRSRPHAVRGRR